MCMKLRLVQNKKSWAGPSKFSEAHLLRTTALDPLHKPTDKSSQVKDYKIQNSILIYYANTFMYQHVMMECQLDIILKCGEIQMHVCTSSLPI
jgi:hypothetical protein